MQSSRMFTTRGKMLHRGPMDRLTGLNKLSVFSTCLLLFIQFQTFQALPTSGSSSPYSNSQISPSFSNNPGAYAPSSSYDSAYPYHSYRPGAGLEDSYRPYSSYQKEQSGLYDPEAVHPNSVYSGQSASSTALPDLEKVLKFLEAEIGTGASLNGPREGKEKLGVSVPITSEKNKPRLAPLVPVSTAPEKETESVKNIKPEESGRVETAAAVDPLHPPPFAPEFDPEYERKQYGLGPLTLLDQAGPFW